MEKSKFTMLVGLPGSGKSTYCNQHPNSEIISLDRLIENTMSENETYAQAFVRVQSSGELKELDKKMFRDADILSKAPKPHVIWDQTNLTIKTRERKLKMFSPSLWYREAVVFDISDEEWQARYDKRAKETGKTIPNFVLEGMKKSFEIPALEEGFDAIHRMDK